MKAFIFLFLLYTLIESQTISWVPDGYIRLSRYDVILNKYSNRFSTFSDFIIPHSYGNPISRQVLSITGLDFTLNGASLGISLKVKNHTGILYKFTVQILNQTVLYSLKVDCLTVHSGAPGYYAVYGQFNCKYLSKGQGHRSQNYSIGIMNQRYYYNFYAQKLLATVFLNSFLVFNPQGKYVHLDWKMHLNQTHYTIEFETNDKNIVTFIGFSLVSSDINFQRHFYFFRMISIGTYQCPGPQCPGTGGFDPSIFYIGDHKQFWGMSGFNFTKYQQITWLLKTTNWADLSLDYVQSSGIKNIKVSSFVQAHRICHDFDPDVDQYFDPATLTCTTDCSTTTNPYSYFPVRLCVGCYYQCQTCDGYFGQNCTSCSSANHRYGYSYPHDDYFDDYCVCQYGYTDIGKPQCRKCSEFMQGCVACHRYDICVICQTGLQPSADKTKCQCIDPSKFLTRTAECIDIDGCLNSWNGTAGQKLCIECDLQKNLRLKSFLCECLPGYVPDLTQPYLTCIEKCGDKIITDNEECDDGNLVYGDGCNSACKIETEYDCFSNYTDASFCVPNHTILRHYETLKVLDQENTAEAYFTFEPFFQKYLDRIDIFRSLFNTSSLEMDPTVFTGINYEFSNYQDKEIRLRIRFRYLETINPSQERYLRFYIRDSKGTHNLVSMLTYNSQSKNYPLYLDHHTEGTQETLAHVMLAGVIVGYVIFLVSLWSENWIGIELIHTVQWLFFYLFLIDNLDSAMAPFIQTLKLSVGFNRIFDDETSPYVFYKFHDKLWRFEYVKQFFLNFNLWVMPFCLPILFALVKLIVDKYRERQLLVKNAFTKVKKQVKKQPSNESQLPSSNCDSFVKNYLSWEFIIGKFALSLVMINLLQTFFCFHIQLSPWYELDERDNRTLYTFFTFSVFLFEVGVIAWLYLQSWEKLTFDSGFTDPSVRKIFKFQSFKHVYPLVYVFCQLCKIATFSLSFEDKICLFVMIVFDGLLLLFYIVVRPYTKPGVEQQPSGYWIHSLHNVWNCVGLIGFLVLVYFANQKKDEEVQQFFIVLVSCVVGIYFGSIFLGALRLIYGLGIFLNCSKNCFNRSFPQQLDNSKNQLMQVKLLKDSKDKIFPMKSFTKIEDFQTKIKITQQKDKQTGITLRDQIIDQLKGKQKEKLNQNCSLKKFEAFKHKRSLRTTYKKI